MSHFFRPRVESLEGRVLLAVANIASDETGAHAEHVDVPADAPDAISSSSVELPSVFVSVEPQPTCNVLVVCVLSNQPTQNVAVEGGEGEWTDFNGFVRLQVSLESRTIDLRITDANGVELPLLRIVLDDQGQVITQTWKTPNASPGVPITPIAPSLDHNHSATGADATNSLAGASMVHELHDSPTLLANVHDETNHMVVSSRSSSSHVISRTPLDPIPGLTDAPAAPHAAPDTSSADTGSSTATASETSASHERVDEVDALWAEPTSGGELGVAEFDVPQVIDLLARQIAPARSASTVAVASPELPMGPAAAQRRMPSAAAEATHDDDEQSTSPLAGWKIAAMSALAATSGAAALMIERRQQQRRLQEKRSQPMPTKRS